MSKDNNDQDLRQQLARLQAENDALKAQKAKSGVIGYKVSEKGAVSVYGLGRFPVTLYQEQWAKLLAHQDDLKAFIQQNQARLAVKGMDKPEAKPETKPSTIVRKSA